mmetsp:Transcript_60430/g.128083  ORF Transcript_60430/g.128083 Transcript_60430/m.128083 type:complete len:653 (-) Transcript_60430:254-2212(-)
MSLRVLDESEGPSSSEEEMSQDQIQTVFEEGMCKSMSKDLENINGEPDDITPDPDAYGNLHITFRDASFSVTQDRKEKVILAPVSGHFEPGTMVAVMGPSGSGKTTLLDILAGKKTKHGGEVRFNGRPRDSIFPRISAYVAQDDVLPAHLTVKEAVTFHQMLKSERPSQLTKEQFQKCTLKSLADLGLLGVQDTLIGNQQVRGISGGQLRRTSLACGAAANPQVMFCDEPTSGLSATDAETVVKYMRLIAHRYKVTCVLNIHQPRLEVVKLFDHLLLLTSRPGRFVYNGPIKDLPNYCAKVGYECPRNSNPTDYVMDLVTPGTEKSNDSQEKFVNYYDQHVKPMICDQVDENMNTERMSCMDILSGMHNRLAAFGTVPALRATKYGVRFRKQLQIVGGRQLTLYYRDTRGVISDVVIAVGKGVILGLTYLRVGSTGASGQLPFYFMLMMATSIDGMKSMPKLISERKVMKVETSEALYSEWAYILPFTLINWIQAIFSNTIFIAIIFGISNLPWALFPPMWLWTTLLYLTMDSMFLMLSAVAKDASIAMVMSLPFFMLFLLFNGFSVNKASAPPVVAWIVSISPVAYAIEQATMAAAHHYSSSDKKPEFDAVINMFAYEDQPVIAIGVMVGVMVAFRLLQMVGLKFFNNIQH